MFLKSHDRNLGVFLCVHFLNHGIPSLTALKIIFLSGDSILVNWDSNVGPHSCSFNIDWLREHDYTTPHVHKERMEGNEPLIAVSGCNFLFVMPGMLYVLCIDFSVEFTSNFRL